MTDQVTPDLFVTRVGPPFVYSHEGERYEGRRGHLVIGPLSEETVERWDVATKLDPDTYDCEFGWWTDRQGGHHEAIRVLLTDEQFERIYPKHRRDELERKVGPVRARGRIYVHVANWPHELEGCIAPGRRRIKNGVGESKQAFAEICKALGGWEEGKRFKLQVTA